MCTPPLFSPFAAGRTRRDAELLSSLRVYFVALDATRVKCVALEVSLSSHSRVERLRRALTDVYACDVSACDGVTLSDDAALSVFFDWNYI